MASNSHAPPQPGGDAAYKRSQRQEDIIRRLIATQEREHENKEERKERLAAKPDPVRFKELMQEKIEFHELDVFVLSQRRSFIEAISNIVPLMTQDSCLKPK